MLVATRAAEGEGCQDPQFEVGALMFVLSLRLHQRSNRVRTLEPLTLAQTFYAYHLAGAGIFGGSDCLRLFTGRKSHFQRDSRNIIL